MPAHQHRWTKKRSESWTPSHLSEPDKLAGDSRGSTECGNWAEDTQTNRAATANGLFKSSSAIKQEQPSEQSRRKSIWQRVASARAHVRCVEARKRTARAIHPMRWESSFGLHPQACTAILAPVLAELAMQTPAKWSDEALFECESVV